MMLNFVEIVDAGILDNERPKYALVACLPALMVSTFDTSGFQAADAKHAGASSPRYIELKVGTL